MKRILAAALLLAVLAGCGARHSEDQTPAAVPPPPVMEVDEDGVRPAAGADEALSGERAAALTEFGLGLFRGCLGEGNVLVSPLSVIGAMTLAANGAAGETLTQMESAFGMSLEALNDCLRRYTAGLPSGGGGAVHLANGIWLNGNGAMRLRPEYRETNEELFHAGIFEAPFDGGTEDEINAWVAENTAGRIGRIVEGLSPDAAAVLVNALAFDGMWEEVYREDQVSAGTFTGESGQVREAEMMRSTEDVYLEDEHAVGFMKYYEGRGYAFAALLPEEGMSLADYAAALTGEQLQSLLAGGEGEPVEAAIPKFSVEYGADLTRTLSGMGITDAFDRARADFFSMAEQAEGNLYVDQVQHRTFLSVDERGTEAGAATAVTFRTASLMGPVKTVTLDRPFLYLLVDCENHIPLFIGALTDIS